MKNKHTNTPKGPVAILGAGSWGTAVAIHLAHSGIDVTLWGRGESHIKAMQQDNENAAYLPGIAFPKSLKAEACLDTVTHDASDIIIAVPSHAFADLVPKLPSHIQGLSWLTKGIDPATNACLSELVAKRYGKDFPMAIISGPSFAKEVARLMPTAIVIAGNQMDYCKHLQDKLHYQNLRVYLSQDLIGVQCAGAVKNVLAIACGISDGLEFGANARAALITRGLAEMSRLGAAMGGSKATFTGLAGLGDLVLTCTDNQSRNRRFGLRIGEGEQTEAAEKAIGQVVEGKQNAEQVCELAKRLHLELPICEQVHAVLTGQTDARKAVQTLLDRPAGTE